MRIIYFIFILILVSIKSFGQEENLNKTPPNNKIYKLDNDSIFIQLDSLEENDLFPVKCCWEIPPEFKGGEKALHKFLSDNLIYPDSSKKAGIEGTIIVSFVIDTTGSVSNISIKKGINKEMNEEVIRVFSIMPSWIPASCPDRKEKRSVKMAFPINFRLE